MWQYEGPNDPTRCSPQELDADDILTRIQQVPKCSSVSEMQLARPYAADYAPPQVCVCVSSLVWVIACMVCCLLTLLVLQDHAPVLCYPPQPEDADILEEPGASAANDAVPTVDVDAVLVETGDSEDSSPFCEK